MMIQTLVQCYVEENNCSIYIAAMAAIYLARSIYQECWIRIIIHDDRVSGVISFCMR